MNHLNFNYHKKFCLLCEECNCLTNQSVSVFFDNVEFERNFYMEFSNEYYCKQCGKVTTQFDVEPGIAKSVRLLRLHGFETKFSCEGHGNGEESSEPYICFVKKELPENFERIINAHGWKIDKGFEEVNDDNLMRISIFDPENKGSIIGEQEFNSFLNDYFEKANKELFKALLEVFIEED